MRLAPLALSALMGLSLGAETQKAGAKPPAKAVSNPKEAKRQDVIRLVKFFGWSAANADAARKQLDAASKDPKLAAYPIAYWKDYEKAATTEAFEKILVPIFEKAYTAEELKAFLKLAALPEFKLFLEKNPDSLVKKEAFEGFSKYMSEAGAKLREKHGLPAPPAIKR